MSSLGTTPLSIIRTARGLSQGDLARKLRKNRATISRIESGEAKASPGLAKQLSDYFDGEITRDQILFPEEYVDGAKKPVRSATPKKKPVRSARPQKA